MKAQAVIDENTRRLAANLKAKREARGLTQRDLAMAAGWGEKGQVRVSHYECGRRLPGIDDLTDLSIPLGCTVRDLLGDVELPPQARQKPPELDERKQVIRLYNRLSTENRTVVMEFINQLMQGEDAERARAIANLRQIAQMSSPATADMISSLARVVEGDALTENDALALRQMINVLAAKRLPDR